MITQGQGYKSNTAKGELIGQFYKSNTAGDDQIGQVYTLVADVGPEKSKTYYFVASYFPCSLIDTIHVPLLCTRTRY